MAGFLHSRCSFFPFGLFIENQFAPTPKPIVLLFAWFFSEALALLTQLGFLRQEGSVWSVAYSLASSLPDSYALIKGRFVNPIRCSFFVKGSGPLPISQKILSSESALSFLHKRRSRKRGLFVRAERALGTSLSFPDPQRKGFLGNLSPL